MVEPLAEILVVDDEVKNVKLLEALLVPRGYAVIKTYRGEEALRYVEQQRPDIILLDVMMPGMSGFEVCQALKDNPETRLIPIVIMTALGEVEDRVKGITAGADDFLTKPVNRDELMARIHTALRLKQTVEQKVGSLEQTRDQLSKFVPHVVKRRILENPGAPALETREQDVSVLFVDISGYTKLSDTLPDDQVQTMVERYFSHFLDCIHGHEGDVNQTAGDGFMSIFLEGESHVHARQAVRAGQEMMRLTHQLNMTLSDGFPPIAIHIGVNSGRALVGSTKFEGQDQTQWTYTASGLVTIVAARLMALAQAGMILIGPETAQRVAGTFSIEEMGEKHLKNIRHKVPVYQVLPNTPNVHDLPES